MKDYFDAKSQSTPPNLSNYDVTSTDNNADNTSPHQATITLQDLV